MTLGYPLTRGDVVLVDFPFTDLSGSKLRPAIIVGRPTGDDFVLAFLSSQVSRPSSPADHLIAPSSSEFSATGLKSPSLVRLNKLATLNRELIQRRLGRIGPRTEHAVGQALRYVFMLDA